jgi:glycosyltransferase involved in cell wall biosynthesis
MKQTISVITICFNNLPELVKTCYSVDKQSVLPDEHLIIDGSTNEEIVNWLLQNPQPLYRRWIHERDKGISDAFNKGIENAKGIITHLLNSGDKYAENNIIETVLKAFGEDNAVMWLHGQYIQHRGDIDVISGLPFEKNELWKGMRTVAHPSMFIKKEIYTRHGTYDVNLTVAMDYDMLVRIRNERFKFISTPLAYFSPGGTSDLQYKKGMKEVRQIYHNHIGYNPKQSLWQLRQQLLRSFMMTGMGKRWFRWKNRKKIATP